VTVRWSLKIGELLGPPSSTLFIKSSTGTAPLDSPSLSSEVILKMSAKTKSTSICTRVDMYSDGRSG
jgi:hypothetical protein